jgi:hypothetical protein
MLYIMSYYFIYRINFTKLFCKKIEIIKKCEFIGYLTLIIRLIHTFTTQKNKVKQQTT